MSGPISGKRPDEHRRLLSLPAALGLTALAVVLPGSSLWLLGRRALGIAVLTSYLTGVAVLAYLLLEQRAPLLRALVRPAWLTAAIIMLVVGFVCWALIVTFSYQMARPDGMTRPEQLAATAFLAVMCLALAVPFGVAVRYASAQRAFISDVFVSAADSSSATRPVGVTAADPWQREERVNMLLVGSDAGPERDGTRTDSMIVASIEVATGNVVLISLPRNLEDVPFPTGTPLHRLYRDGFTGPGDPLEWMLNAVYGRVPELHPGVLGRSDNEGADALKLAISGALGIPVEYYVMVDLSGFVQLVDAMGGVTVNINSPIPIGGVTGERAPEGYLEPGVAQHLDGFEAMWFARGRYGLDDYDRMRRQRCLMAAVIDEADPVTLLTRYDKILDAGREIISTDLPSELLPAFVDLALRVKDGKVRSVVFERSENFVPEAPDYDWVHQVVDAALERSGTGGGGGQKGSLAQSPVDACAYDPVG